MWGLIIVETSRISDPAAPTALWSCFWTVRVAWKIVTDLLARFGLYSQIEILFALYSLNYSFFPSVFFLLNPLAYIKKI